MLCGIFGALGSGKTLTAVYLAKQRKNNDYYIYSNFELRFADMVMSAEEMLMRLIFNEIENERVLFVIDELGQVLNAENWYKSESKLLSPVFLKSRKMGIDIIYTSQTFALVNVNVRRITDICIKTDYNPRNTQVTATIFTGAPDGFLHAKDIRFLGRDYFAEYNTREIITPRPEELARYIAHKMTEEYGDSVDKKKMKNLLKVRFGIYGDFLLLVLGEWEEMLGSGLVEPSEL